MGENEVWLKEQLETVYDYNFVQTKILDPMKIMEPEIKILVEKIKTPIITSASVVSATNNPNFQPTIPQPFNLTKPTIRPLPQPTHECKYRPVKPNPVPKNM